MTNTETDKKKIKFLIVGKNTWGNGRTYEEANRNYRDAGGDRWNIVYMWPGPSYPHKAFVWGWGVIEWEDTSSRPILIQDNRRASDKRERPIEIGEVLGASDS
tara:strand:- start:105 stop:413 length:309 start_codon:yes stop_codon:yes gene_type:complete